MDTTPVSTKDCLYQLADSMALPKDMMDQFVQKLQDNWYHTTADMKTLKLDDFTNMGFPLRLAKGLLAMLNDTQQ